MSKGERFPAEWRSFTADRTGIEVRQLTNYKGHSYHLYFTNPGWYDGGRKLLFASDRCNATNLFSLELASGETVTLATCGALTVMLAVPSTLSMVAVIVGGTATEGAQAAGRHGHAELPGGSVVGAQLERDDEGEEADDAPQQAHGGGGEQDAAAAQLFALLVGGGVVGHPGRRDARTEAGGDREHDRRQHQHALAAGDEHGDAAGNGGREPHDARQE